ncbi:maleylacetoacetate isomerase [Phenylobacterium sp.]|uniref:maleylacetoacetate isomerase n=1 Tax=Phenylobacterium sp. TaxID=1871053 RepID=UPI0039195175
MALALHSYWRAGAPYRVRIGLHLKGLPYDYVPVNLLAGDQHGAAYKGLNPQGLTPALVVDDGLVLTQSLAILEWLEETHPEPPLLPRSAADRAVVRAMAGIVACDIHPLNNQRVLKALAGLGVDEAGRNAWAARWIAAGFEALEPMIARHGAGFAFGESPTLADCCLVPQVYSAGRFGVDLSAYPAIRAAAERAAAHPAFAAAHPERQPDAA